MSLNGKLEDVSLADVMQFVHLGRRTGTLSLRRGSLQASVGFHRGQIVSAWAPGCKRLGELLVEKRLIDTATLQQVLRTQASELPRRSIGQVLVASGALEFDDIRKAVQEQIESAIYTLVTWSTGSFEFALDELKPLDDIAMYPGDVIPKLDLNTQRVLLEAARILDESQKSEGSSAPTLMGDVNAPPPSTEAVHEDHGLPSSPGGGESLHLEDWSGLDVEFALDETAGGLAPAHRRLQIVSPDRQLAAALTQLVEEDVAVAIRVPLREAGTRLPGEPTPTIVMLDVRDGSNSPEDLRAIRRSRPRSSVIAIVDTQDETTRALEAGAVAALRAEPVALAACFHSLLRTLQEASPEGVATANPRAGFARLRRVLADIRSGLLSATMALNLMHVISESVERAVLFLVKQDALIALGAFGFSADHRPLAEVTRSLRLSLGSDHAMTRCVADGQPRSLSFDQAQLPEELARVIGRPRNGQIVIFPVLGAERVISVVYTDNGSSARAIEDIELLELATAQVGVAFENELLRRKIENQS